MGAVAILSNPHSTGNRALLPQIRAFCDGSGDLHHFEVETVGEIGGALEAIAAIKPAVLVINGGDGTVQSALTEIYNGGQFGREPPPVAVLPNGKTNLIALDLGSVGDPMAALYRIVELANGDISPHLVERELIALTEGEAPSNRPVLGMFLGGAGLADTILFCRHSIYPLGLPNGASHVLAAIAVIVSVVFGLRSRRFLPPAPNPVRVSLIREGEGAQRFAFLIVTTLEKMLMGSQAGGGGGMKLVAVDQSRFALLRAFFASLKGNLGLKPVRGVHVAQGDVIRIESDRSSVILDGEEFHARTGFPIVLRATPPMPFLRLAA